MTNSPPRSILFLIAIAVAITGCEFPRPSRVSDDATAPVFQLSALEPSLAATGDTITIEGTFAETAVVHFPGNADETATILGSHRASVAVPATATAGDLTVETGGSTLGPLPFRRVSFALGLQTFHLANEQTGGARQTSKLVAARSGHSTAVIGQFLYVIGGIGAGGYMNSVERATVNADGSLGELAIVPEVALATARSGHMAVVIGRSLFVIGGESTGGALSSIEIAPIHSDGTLGAFQVAPIKLAASRKNAASSLVGPFLYVFGGTENGLLGSIERATIAADGSLGEFSIVADLTLAAPRAGHAAVVSGGFLYLLGGSTTSGGGATNAIERAAIDGGGQLGAFKAVPQVLATARTNHAALVLGTTLYVLGGLGSNANLNTVEKATIGPDGSLGSFEASSTIALAKARSSHAAIMVRNYVYLIGGTNDGHLDSVERAAIEATGRLGRFSVISSSTLTAARTAAANVVIGDWVYSIGGYIGNAVTTPLDSVERAAVSPDGSLGPFSIVPGLTLNTARSQHISAVIGHYLYIVGGNGSGGAGTNGNPLPSVERATIDATGQLGPFLPLSGITLGTARCGAVAVVVGSTLYVLGGSGLALTYPTNVERASIAPDGSLGRFSSAPGVALQTGRLAGSAALIGTTVYVLGGYSTDSGRLSSVEHASVIGDALDTFTVAGGVALIAPRSDHAGIVVGGSLYLLGGVGGASENLLTTLESAPTGPSGLTGTFTLTSGVDLTTTRTGHTSLMIGNFVYVVGDSATIEQAPLL